MLYLSNIIRSKNEETVKINPKFMSSSAPAVDAPYIMPRFREVEKTQSLTNVKISHNYKILSHLQSTAAGDL